MRLRGATSVAAATTTIRRRRTPFLAYDSACGGNDELRWWGMEGHSGALVGVGWCVRGGEERWW